VKIRLIRKIRVLIQNSHPMEKSTLLAVLRATSKRERREISDWLRSPSHNLRQDVVILFDFLVEKNRFEQPVEKEKVWSLLFKNEAFDDARMRQVMYFLLKTIEEYLIWAELTKDDMRKIAALSSVYRRRQLEKPFRQSMENAKKTAENSVIRNAVHLQNAFNLEMEEYKYLTSVKGHTQFNLQELSNSLDAAFVAQKLRIASLMLTHQRVYNAEYDTGLLDDVLRFVETHHLLEKPAVATYFYCLKTIIDKENEANYEQFEHRIFEFGQHFPVTEQRELYLFALNYCLGRANSGHILFVRKAFELYKRGFDQKILLEDGVISGKTFINAVQSALKLKEFTWVEQFVVDYRQYIEEKRRTSVANFTLSRLHFEQKNYDEAMKLMLNFEFDDVLWNIIAKTMLLKIYYEREQIGPLESLMDSISAYLRRKDVIGYHRLPNKNFLSLCRKMLHLPPNNKIAREKLRVQMVETNPLFEREWLLSQLKK
jgi:hypothetical protein